MTRYPSDFIELTLDERLEGVPDAALQSIISREAGVRSHAQIDDLSVFQPGSSVDGGQLATILRKVGLGEVNARSMHPILGR